MAALSVGHLEFPRRIFYDRFADIEDYPAHGGTEYPFKGSRMVEQHQDGESSWEYHAADDEKKPDDGHPANAQQGAARNAGITTHEHRASSARRS